MSVKAPFTEEQIVKINSFQENDATHEFTCCGPENIPECTRSSGESNGTLVAYKENLICPCGKYTQDWVHEEMTK